MFNKLKRWFDWKGKRAVALPATMILLCGFTGCDSKETSNTATDSAVSGLQSTPAAESKDSQISEANSGNTGSSDDQNGAQSEYDFNEAVKNITIFDSKIFLPCTTGVLERIFH